MPVQSISRQRRNRLVTRGKEILQRLSTHQQGTVVVDDDDTTRADPIIQGRQRVHGGFVEVAVKPEQRNLIGRGSGQRVAKPALEKDLSLVVEQPVNGEIFPHGLFRNRELGEFLLGQVDFAS